MAHSDTCGVEMYRPNSPDVGKYGPFQRCGRKHVPGYDVCRVHLRVELRSLERAAKAMRESLGITS